MPHSISIFHAVQGPPPSLKTFIIYPDGYVRIYWDLFVVIFVVYNAVVVPISLAFGGLDNTFWTVLDSCVDLLFCFDIALNFRTGTYPIDSSQWHKSPDCNNPTTTTIFALYSFERSQR